jgi:antitoxin YefM
MSNLEVNHRYYHIYFGTWQLGKKMKKVSYDHFPVIITRKAAQPVVMMYPEDFEALEETAYLLRSPKNARRLLESVAELERDKGSERELVN